MASITFQLSLPHLQLVVALLLADNGWIQNLSDLFDRFERLAITPRA